MKTPLKIYTLSHKIFPCDPVKSYESMLDAILKAPSDADIIVCPAYSFGGVSCGNFYHNELYVEKSKVCLERLCEQTKHLDCFIAFGMAQNGKNCAYLIYKGEILIEQALNDDSLTTAQIKEQKVGVLNCAPAQISDKAYALKNADCDIILYPLATNVTAGKIDKIESDLKGLAQKFDMCIAVSNLGLGETSFPYVYKAFTAVYAKGQRLCFEKQQAFEKDVIHSICEISCNFAPCKNAKPDYDIKVEKIVRNPFVPDNADGYLSEVFELSSYSLAVRMKKVGITKMVVGISGGLDSTLALLACVNTANMLGISNDNIIAITMPGFGTSDRTYQNAVNLIKELGCTFKEISIKESVTLHLNEIGHNLENKDVTYENAQARERTQILLDVANMYGAVVVGTGDLSEEALGFATFAGDHISNYNVNVCYTKNMIRQTVALLCEDDMFKLVANYLRDVLDTPVSPELLPPDKEGKITQKTEDILGPYELHDFFLYYFVHKNNSPKTVVEYATGTFPEFTKEYIEQKLELFIKKFFAAQFKRSCAPDSACITEVNLTNVKMYMPSDAKSQFYIDAIKDNE